MSMILEDIEDFVEVDLFKTPLSPIPESPAASITPKTAEVTPGGGDETKDGICEHKHTSGKAQELLGMEGPCTPKDSITIASRLSTIERVQTFRRRVAQAVQRFVQALAMPCIHKGGETEDDNNSLDGHLFEYAVHEPIIPQVSVPRLQLKPTLRERAANVSRRLVVCGRKQQSYECSVS